MFLSIYIEKGAGYGLAINITYAPWSAKYIPKNTDGAKP